MRVVILGNSGAGKSTLARRLAQGENVSVLDLDTLVWEPGKIAVARDPVQVRSELEHYCATRSDWILEGCYADCAGWALAWKPELILLDPGVEVCLAHCRNRPWEPHKYATREEQDRHLGFLLEWVSSYPTREGPMGGPAHRALFEAYDGPKRRLTA